MTGGLKYCNSCGVRLAANSEDKGAPAGRMLIGILVALSLIVTIGFGILIPLLGILLQSNVKSEIVVLLTLAYLATIFGICFSLVRQVPKLIDARLKSADGYSAAEPVEQTLVNPRTTAQLEEYRVPVSSVTDHTTRTLEKVPLDRSDRI